MADHRSHGVVGVFGGFVQIAIQRRRLRTHRKRAQHLPRIIPPERRQLAKHHITCSDLARRRQLSRHIKMRRRHRGDADVVNHVGAAVSDVGAFHQRRQFAFVESRLAAFEQRCERRIAHRRTDTEPVEFLLRLDHAQSRVIGVKALHHEALFELLVFAMRQRPDHADVFGATFFQLRNATRHAFVAAPLHIDCGRNDFCQRKVVVPLHEHGHLHAGLEDRQRLNSAGPAGHPLRGIAGAVVGDDQQMIDTMFFHRRAECRMAPRIFRLRKSRVFLRQDRLLTRIQFQLGHD